MISEKVKQQKEANKRAQLILDEVREYPVTDIEFLEDRLQEYCRIKLLLMEEEPSDNITLMAQQNVANASGIPIEKLPGVETPGVCGGASEVLTVRIQLFLSVQRGLDIQIDPKATPGIMTVRDLAEIVMSGLQQ